MSEDFFKNYRYKLIPRKNLGKNSVSRKKKLFFVMVSWIVHPGYSTLSLRKI